MWTRLLFVGDVLLLEVLAVLLVDRTTLEQLADLALVHKELTTVRAHDYFALVLDENESLKSEEDS